MFERGQRRATPHDVGAGERDKAVRVTVGHSAATDSLCTPSVCWVQSSPDWRAGHGDAPVCPTMKGSPRPRFASDTATGPPVAYVSRT